MLNAVVTEVHQRLGLLQSINHMPARAPLEDCLPYVEHARGICFCLHVETLESWWRAFRLLGDV